MLQPLQIDRMSIRAIPKGAYQPFQTEFRVSNQPDIGTEDPADLGGVDIQVLAPEVGQVVVDEGQFFRAWHRTNDTGREFSESVAWRLLGQGKR